MSTAAFVAVLVSTLLHPTWNYLVKRNQHPFTVLWGAVVLSCGVLLPYALASPGLWHLDWSGWLVLAVATLFNGGYYWLLAQTYSRGDLSRVYPYTRGIAPIFILVAESLLLGVHPSALGAASVMVIAGGVYVLHLESFDKSKLLGPLTALIEPVSRLALLNALCITGYSIANKVALSNGLDPVVLYAPTNLVGALVLVPFARRLLAGSLAETWRTARRDMVIIGVVQTAAYLLVLWAMARAPVGYVEAVRQVGIVFGALLGIRLLGESFGQTRFVGALIIVVGVLGIRLFG